MILHFPWSSFLPYKIGRISGFLSLRAKRIAARFSSYVIFCHPWILRAFHVQQKFPHPCQSLADKMIRGEVWYARRRSRLFASGRDGWPAFTASKPSTPAAIRSFSGVYIFHQRVAMTIPPSECARAMSFLGESHLDPENDVLPPRTTKQFALSSLTSSPPNTTVVKGVPLDRFSKNPELCTFQWSVINQAEKLCLVCHMKFSSGDANPSCEK